LSFTSRLSAAALALLSCFIVRADANVLAVPPPPGVEAKSWILVDHVSGRRLAGGNEDLRVEPASITKVMTAYVAFRALAEGRLKLQEPVTISERAWRAKAREPSCRWVTKFRSRSCFKA